MPLTVFSFVLKIDKTYDLKVFFTIGMIFLDVVVNNYYIRMTSKKEIVMIPRRSKMTEPCRILSIYIPLTVYDKLDGLGNKSEHVRKALDEYFERIEQK